MRSTNLFLFIAVLLLFGCKSQTGAEQSQNTFSDGNSWIYSDQDFFANGQSGPSNIDSVYVISSTVISGKKNLFLNNAITELLDDAGNVIIKYSFNFSFPHFSYDLPSKAGDTISRIDSTPFTIDGNAVSGSILMIARNNDTVITVPGGSFHCCCFEIETSIQNSAVVSRTYRYICPSAGLIKFEAYAFDLATGIRWLENQTELIRIVK